VLLLLLVIGTKNNSQSVCYRQHSALTAGNTTMPHTQQISTQAVYDSRKDKRLSKDIYHELEIINDTYRSLVGKRVKRYIQGLGGVPFWTLFSREAPLECFRDIRSSGSAVLHFDSTGSVMKRLSEQKQPYYYTLPAAQDSMLVCEFLTTCHRHRVDNDNSRPVYQ